MKNEKRSLGKRKLALPSAVEGSRGRSFKVTPRDSSTPLGMTEAETRVLVRIVQRKHPLDRHALQSFAEKALRLCLQTPGNDSLLPTLREIDILLVSDRRMAALHQQFMNINGPTDVLTFQHGEIFVSVDTAAQNAPRFQTSLEDEIRLYMVHGLLHLHGFDDNTSMQARAMKARQTRILRQAAAT